MRPLSTIALMLALAGCNHRVEVALPAAPAVALDTDTVAVVAAERSCRDVADALVERLNAMPGLQVDPHSPVRLHVAECSTSFDPRVDITVSADSDWRGRITMVGRGHAVVHVEAGGLVQAHLIASGERYAQGEVQADAMVSMRKRVSRTLTEAVADDLTEQIRPIPRVVQRRIYPNAPTGTARAHLNLAVSAELAGDLSAASAHARRAHELSPSAEIAAYVRELDQLVQRLDTAPPSPQRP